jgi:transcriptional regulator with XRE-family HTH domain
LNLSDEPQEMKRIVGQTLARFRRDANITQEKLAEIAGLERGYISLIERGLRMPTVDTVFRLCRGLRIRPFEMIRAVEVLAEREKRPKL